MHNHLCSYECKFCPTTRATLAHTLGTKRQTNLAKRAARETKDVVAHPQANKRKVVLFLILTWWPSTLYQATKILSLKKKRRECQIEDEIN
ncbi:splicing factor 3A subunit 2-like isoform X2 [Punica granatum]|uniref:Splicing factor 3A subunit 2-like isoform X2 n=1 Tax=Punica granatum TaxID=22663 RepID=A0A6P8EAJ8_PUNGR|nr:splicing factor 3A subunit 2-like isoform X2 [Punica granatum]